MRLFDTSFAGDHEQLGISVEDHVHIFGTKRDHSSVVHDEVGKKCVSLLVRVFNLFLFELELCHTEATKDHER